MGSLGDSGTCTALKFQASWVISSRSQRLGRQPQATLSGQITARQQTGEITPFTGPCWTLQLQHASQAAPERRKAPRKHHLGQQGPASVADSAPRSPLFSTHFPHPPLGGLKVSSPRTRPTASARPPMRSLPSPKERTALCRFFLRDIPSLSS